MKQWFSCKANYMEQSPEGELKSVTKTYLVDAVNFTEAEKKVHELLEEIAYDSVGILTASTKTKVESVVVKEGFDKYFQAKVQYISVEGDKEKKVSVLLIITGDTIKDVYESAEEYFENMLVPYEIPEIKLTPIVDIILHNEE